MRAESQWLAETTYERATPLGKDWVRFKTLLPNNTATTSTRSGAQNLGRCERESNQFSPIIRPEYSACQGFEIMLIQVEQSKIMEESIILRVIWPQNLILPWATTAKPHLTQHSSYSLWSHCM